MIHISGFLKLWILSLCGTFFLNVISILMKMRNLKHLYSSIDNRRPYCPWDLRNCKYFVTNITYNFFKSCVILLQKERVYWRFRQISIAQLLHARAARLHHFRLARVTLNTVISFGGCAGLLFLKKTLFVLFTKQDWFSFLICVSKVPEFPLAG